MTDGDALLKAILAAPDEDTPRLVYADWLDEQGEGERAEFIRLQVRHARACNYCQGYGFPGNVRCAVCDQTETEYSALFRRQLELLSGRTIPEGDSESWCAKPVRVWFALPFLPTPIPLLLNARAITWAACTSGPDTIAGTLSRGFVEKVATSAAVWEQHGDAICELQPIRAVEFADTLFTDPLPVIWNGNRDLSGSGWRLYRVAGRTVEVREEDIAEAVFGTLAHTWLILSARWPSIPRDGWSLADTTPITPAEPTQVICGDGFLPEDGWTIEVLPSFHPPRDPFAGQPFGPFQWLAGTDEIAGYLTLRLPHGIPGPPRPTPADVHSEFGPVNATDPDGVPGRCRARLTNIILDASASGFGTMVYEARLVGPLELRNPDGG